jgi:hypothetical protein
MPRTATIKIEHDHDALSIIDMFNSALKKFEVSIVDVTDPDGVTVDIVLTDDLKADDTLWGK